MSVSNSHELKQLKTRLAKAEAEAAGHKEEAKLAQKREGAARGLCVELRRKIANLEGKATIMTEHALLRYFERVLGYDLTAIQKGLLTDSVLATIEQLPNGKIPSVGCRLVVKDSVVVTLEV